MRPRAAFLTTMLACCVLSAAAARGASLSSSAPGSATRTVEARLQAAPGDALLEHTEAEYRAAYFYALSCLAGLGGDPADRSLLLQRAQEADPDSRLLMEESAEASLELGKPDAAAGQLRHAVALNPGDLDLRRKLSRVYRETGRIAEARALFLKPDGSDPDDPEWLRCLVGLDFEQGDFASAERRLRALLQQGGGVDDRELLGLTLQRRQRWPEAAAEYRKVVALDPSRSSSWGRLADCEESQGDTTSARADLLSGLKADPGSPLLDDQLGRLLYRTEDFQGAEQAFGRLVERDPTDTHSLLYRGLSRLKNRRYQEAEADFTLLGGLQKDDPDQGYALALAYMMQKKYGQAEDQLKKVIKLNGQAEAAWAQLALVYEREKKGPAAVEALRQGLKTLPGSEELALLLSAELEDRNELPAAEEALRDSLKHGGGDEVRFQLAVILDKRGDFPAAEKELSDLIAESPRHAQALNYLGYSWADKGVKLDQAEALIRRALEVDPGNRYYLDSLGWTLFKAGRAKDALDPLDQASKGMADSSDADEALVFEHLAAVQASLGLQADADMSKARAQAIRSRSAARPAGDADAPGGGEPGL